jgi:glycosyltransferase involved in cell wall biosynthesis
VAVSRDLERWLVHTVGIPAAKVQTIHNGVDTERFTDEGRGAGRAALGVADDTLVIGTVGRLDPVKDQIGLLDAFAALPSSDRAVLVVVGDGPCRAALKARAARPDLASRVRFLGERGDVATLLPGFDVFALSSISEGISNTLLEAMACGLPVVATRTGGNPELVVPGVTGALVPVSDCRALARALATYGEDAHLRALHGKAGRERAVEHFSLGEMTCRHRDLYATLARRGA